MGTEVIYHNKCACLYANSVMDEDCIKRFYLVYDAEKDSYKKIFICNELIRSMMNRYKYDDDYRLRNCDRYFRDDKGLACICAEDIISEYIEDTREYDAYNRLGSMSNDFFDQYVCVSICNRPSIIRRYSMRDALRIAYRHFRYSQFKIDLIQNIREYLGRNTYKKYKTKYSQVQVKLNKLLKEHDEQASLIITNEILKLIFDLNIKNKSI